VADTASAARRAIDYGELTAGTAPKRSRVNGMKTGQTPEVDGLSRRTHSVSLDVGVSVARPGRLSPEVTSPAPQESLEFLDQICTAALDALASPLYAVARHGRILLANRAAESLIRRGKWLRIQDGFLTPSQPHRGPVSFSSALERLHRGAGSNVLLADAYGKQAIVSLSPVLPRAVPVQPQAARALGLIWVTTTEYGMTSVTQVARLFQLTGAEQNLLGALIDGDSLRAVAVRHRISIHTARNQLKSIFRKTDCHGQPQLMALVARVATLRIATDP
jgi:DNA-binding CsgD family transcriptional regulator